MEDVNIACWLETPDLFLRWLLGFADPGHWCEWIDRSPTERKTPASWYRTWSWSPEAVCPFHCLLAAVPAPPEVPCWLRPGYFKGHPCFRSIWQDGRRIIRFWDRCKARSSRVCRPSIRPRPRLSDFSVIITRIIHIQRWAIIPWYPRSLAIIPPHIICTTLLITEKRMTRRKVNRYWTKLRSLKLILKFISNSFTFKSQSAWNYSIILYLYFRRSCNV